MSQGMRFTGPESDPFRYWVDDAIVGSAGGQGVVYPAWTIGPDGSSRRVALKLLSAPDLDVSRMLAMAEPLRSVDHPHLVRQLNVFLGTGLCPRATPRGPEGVPFDIWYVVSDWVEGTDFADTVGTVTAAVALGWVADIAAALAYLHGLGEGVIHRDVKPSNVRITAEGESVLVDYGSARQLSGKTMTQGVGTPGWQAPEVLFEPSQVGPAADTWGVAALAHWVVTGNPPTIGSLDAHRERLRLAASRAGLKHPADFAKHVAPLLATEPDARPATSPKALQTWSATLRRIARGGRRSSNRRTLAVCTAALIVALGTAVVLANRLTPAASSATGSTHPAPTRPVSTFPPNTTTATPHPETTLTAELRRDWILDPRKCGPEPTDHSRPHSATHTYEVTATIHLWTGPSIASQKLAVISSTKYGRGGVGCPSGSGPKATVQCKTNGDLIVGPFSNTDRIWERVKWSGRTGFVPDEWLDTKWDAPTFRPC